MAAQRRDPAEIAALIEQGIARGLDLVSAFRTATGQSATRGASRILEREHRRAIEQHRRATSTYQRRLHRWRLEQSWGAAIGIGSGVIAVIDLAAAATPGWWGGWLLAAGLGAGASWHGRRALRSARPPAAPLPSVPAPPILPRQAIGSLEVSRFTHVRVQVASVATSLDRLQPDAGGELRRADAEAAGPLTALTERLLVLHQLQQELPGSEAAKAAAASANIVRIRLAEGSATYDELLAAAARLLSAPDASRSTAEILGPAISAMLAYAHGLERASDTFQPE